MESSVLYYCSDFLYLLNCHNVHFPLFLGNILCCAKRCGKQILVVLVLASSTSSSTTKCCYNFLLLGLGAGVPIIL